MGPHREPRGMGLKDPWASSIQASLTQASRTRGPMGGPMVYMYIDIEREKDRQIDR